MKYYVTDCITGTIEGVEPVGTLEEAMMRNNYGNDICDQFIRRNV